MDMIVCKDLEVYDHDAKPILGRAGDVCSG